jgi:hypothetical protein
MCHRSMDLLCCVCSGRKVSRVGSNMFALFVRLFGNCLFHLVAWNLRDHDDHLQKHILNYDAKHEDDT